MCKVFVNTITRTLYAMLNLDFGVLNDVKKRVKKIRYPKIFWKRSIVVDN